MSVFTVTAIIDGDTFDVNPQWNWKGQTGTRIRPTGYDAPELHAYGGQEAKDKLARLILNKDIELGNARTIDRGRVVCDVYYQGKYLADYFPEYQ
ncbi:MAG TPA: thermonuclease family protein [Thermodesulfobacteriota bacterium]|nr:thermonuclease family protein [Thermodesulfobacteriota bacterium]HNU72801.1 thermonuclease family protein [Thermodesulfobacteriota bacterium]